jgi:hypothetical protein
MAEEKNYNIGTLKITYSSDKHYGTLVFQRGDNIVKFIRPQRFLTRVNNFEKDVDYILKNPTIDYTTGYGSRVEVKRAEDGYPIILFKQGNVTVKLDFDEYYEFLNIINNLKKISNLAATGESDLPPFEKIYYLRGFKIEIDVFGSLILTRGKDSVKIRKVRHLYARMNKIHETVRLILSMPLNYDYRNGFGTRTEIREDGDGFPEILFKSG